MHVSAVFCPATSVCPLTTSDHDASMTTLRFSDVTQAGSRSIEDWCSTWPMATNSTSPSTRSSMASTRTTDPSAKHSFPAVIIPTYTSSTTTKPGMWVKTHMSRRRQCMQGSTTPHWGLSSSLVYANYTVMASGRVTTANSDVMVCANFDANFSNNCRVIQSYLHALTLFFVKQYVRNYSKLCCNTGCK